MGLTLTGKVVGKVTGSTPKGTPFNALQILVKTVKGTALIFNVDDFDMGRKVDVEKEIVLPVFASPYVGKNGKGYIQYKAITGEAAAPQSGKAPRV